MAATVQSLIAQLGIVDEMSGPMASVRQESALFANDTRKLVKEIQRLDNHGAAVSKNIKSIRDAELRAKVAAKTLTASLTGQISTLDKLEDKLTLAKIKLDNMGAAGTLLKGAMVGGFAAIDDAALAAGVAIARLVSSSITAYTKSNKDAAFAVAQLDAAQEKLLVSLGGAIIGGEKGAASIDNMTVTVERLTTTIDKNAEEIRGFVEGTVTAIEGVIKVLSVTSALALTVPLAIVDVVKEAVFGTVRALAGYWEFVGEGLVALGAISEETMAPILKWSDEFQDDLKGMTGTSNSFAISMWESVGSVHGLTTELADAVKGTRELRREFEALPADTFIGPKPLPSKPKRSGRGGGRGAPRPKAVSAADAGFAGQGDGSAFGSLTAQEQIDMESVDRARAEESDLSGFAGNGDGSAFGSLTAQEQLDMEAADELAESLEALAEQKRADAEANEALLNQPLVEMWTQQSAAIDLMNASFEATSSLIPQIGDAFIDASIAAATGTASLGEAFRAFGAQVGDIMIGVGKTLVFTALGLQGLSSANPLAIGVAGAGLIAVGAVLKGSFGGGSAGVSAAGNTSTAAIDDVAGHQDRISQRQLEQQVQREERREFNLFFADRQIRGVMGEVVNDLFRRGEVSLLNAADGGL